MLLLSAAAWVACGVPDADDTDGGQEQELLEYADAGIPERVDAGPPVEVEVCFDLTLAESQLPRSTAATRDCIAACPEGDPGEACRNDCWGNDPTPPDGDIACSDCVFRQLIGCIDVADDGVCHGAAAAYVCCLFDGGTCEVEANEMFTCGFVSEPECFNLVGGEIGRCYAETDSPDGGP